MRGLALGTDRANRFVRTARLFLDRTSTDAASSGASRRWSDRVTTVPSRRHRDDLVAKAAFDGRHQGGEKGEGGGVRMSKLLSSPLLKLANGRRMPPMSRREAERLIRAGQVSIGGQVVTKPHHLLDNSSLLNGEEGDSKSTNTAVTVRGKAFSVNENDLKVFLKTQDGDDDDGASFARRTNPKLAATRVWIAHKLSGEIVSDADPHGRPSLLQRLTRGGVGRLRDGTRLHLKPIGRLDMTTEGLILMTNDGQYARDMELPESGLHRTYRARVHGPLDGNKMRRIRGGVAAPDGTRYAPMRVSADPTSRFAGTNKWVEVTCTEGKNRQIRKVFSHLGRTSIFDM